MNRPEVKLPEVKARLPVKTPIFPIEYAMSKENILVKDVKDSKNFVQKPISDPWPELSQLMVDPEMFHRHRLRKVSGVRQDTENLSSS